MTKTENPPTHYEILALPPPSNSAPTPTQAAVKLAYHRALLTHHPDKSHPTSQHARYTVDQITLAYHILSDANLRVAYDQSLLKGSERTSKRNANVTPAGEVVDLDDLAYDEEGESWYRGCRCGQEKGFRVTEEDLEMAVGEREKEVVTGCRGCSLWIRVLFGVVDAG